MTSKILWLLRQVFLWIAFKLNEIAKNFEYRKYLVFQIYSILGSILLFKFFNDYAVANQYQMLFIQRVNNVRFDHSNQFNYATKLNNTGIETIFLIVELMKSFSIFLIISFDKTLNIMLVFTNFRQGAITRNSSVFL